MELHQAITKMEQGGSADGILQVDSLPLAMMGYYSVFICLTLMHSCFSRSVLIVYNMILRS